MAEPLRLRHRRRLKRKEAEPVLEALRDGYGMEIDPELPMDGAEVEHTPIYLIGGDIIAMEVDGKTAPTLRALLKWPAKKRWVTVDMGAIKFVTNGADVMAPGITDADPEVRPDDPVWIRDETHGRPLAVGVATQSGPELKEGSKGKVIRNLHTVGDKFWTFGHES